MHYLAYLASYLRAHSRQTTWHFKAADSCHNNKMGWKKYIFLPLFLIQLRQLILHLQDPTKAVERVQERLSKLSAVKSAENFTINQDEIVLAAVACGDLTRLDELSTMLKSAVIFNRTKKLKFLIFTDNLAQDIEKILKYWQDKVSHTQFTWDIRPPLYPPLTKVSL